MRMRNVFVFMMIFLLTGPLFAETWHWAKDGQSFMKEEFDELILNAKANGDFDRAREIQETYQKMIDEIVNAEYVPFTDSSQVSKYMNTNFISDEGRRMTCIGGRVKKGEFYISFMAGGGKVIDLTPEEAFAIITVDGHPFGIKKEVEDVSTSE